MVSHNSHKCIILIIESHIKNSSTIGYDLSLNLTVITSTTCRIYRIYFHHKACGLVNSHTGPLGLTSVVVRHHNGVMRVGRGGKILKQTGRVRRCAVQLVSVRGKSISGFCRNGTIVTTITVDRSGIHRQNRQRIDCDRLVGAGGTAVTIRHLYANRVLANIRPANILHVGRGTICWRTAAVRPFIAVQVVRRGCERYRCREIGAVLTDCGSAVYLRYRNCIHSDFHRPAGNTLRIVVHHNQRKVSRAGIRPGSCNLFAVRINGSTRIVCTPTISVGIGCPIGHLLHRHRVSIQRTIGTHLHRSGKNQCQGVFHNQHIAAR